MLLLVLVVREGKQEPKEPDGSPSIVAFPTGTLTAPGGGAGGISQPATSYTDGNPGGAGGGASNYNSGNNPHPGGTGDGAPWARNTRK